MTKRFLEYSEEGNSVKRLQNKNNAYFVLWECGLGTNPDEVALIAYARYGEYVDR